MYEVIFSFSIVPCVESLRILEVIKNPNASIMPQLCFRFTKDSTMNRSFVAPIHHWREAIDKRKPWHQEMYNEVCQTINDDIQNRLRSVKCVSKRKPQSSVYKYGAVLLLFVSDVLNDRFDVSHLNSCGLCVNRNLSSDDIIVVPVHLLYAVTTVALKRQISDKLKEILLDL